MFIGKTPKLKGHIYDTAATKGAAKYNKMTDAIALLLGKDKQYRHQIKQVILTLVEPTFTTSSATGTDNVSIAIFNESIKDYVRTKESIKRMLQLAYNTVYGQCTESLIVKLKGRQNYFTFSAAGNTLGLLRVIKAKMIVFVNNEYICDSLHLIMRDFYLLSQGQRETQEYFKDFNHMAETIKDARGSIGRHPEIVSEELKESGLTTDTTSNDEIKASKVNAQERYLATAFLLGSRRNKFVPLIKKIQNNYLTKSMAGGTGSYPKTVAEALKFLKKNKNNTNYIRDLIKQELPTDDGVSFLMNKNPMEGNVDKTNKDNKSKSTDNNNTTNKNKEHTTLLTDNNNNKQKRKIKCC